MKAVLEGIVIITAILMSLSAILLIGYQGEGAVSSNHILQFKSDKFEDSTVFASRVRDVAFNVLDGIASREQMETEDGKYDPDRLVDVEKFYETNKITGKNESGLAYTLEDLGEWGSQFNEGNYENTNIVVCEKPDGRYYYYYLSEFETLLRNKELQVENPYEEEELTHSEFIEELVYSLEGGYSPVDYYGEELQIQDAEGNVLYKDFWSFPQGIEEKATPDGAKNILEVVNRTPELNGRLEEVFQMLESTISSIAVNMDLYQHNDDTWAEGNTNFQYLLVDQKSKEIKTNNSAYTAYEEIDANIEKMKKIGKYVVVKPKLAEFESNMEVSASEWRNVVAAYHEIDNDYIFVAAVDTEYPVQDIFYTSAKEYGKYAPYLKSAGSVLVISGILFLVSMVWLTVCAGRCPENEKLKLSGFDRWKTGLGAMAVIVPWILISWFLGMNWSGIGYQALSYGEESFHHSYVYYMFSMTASDILIISLYTGITMVLFLIGYLSLVRRMKAKTLWKNSLLRWGCGVLGQFWRHRSVCLRSALLVGGFVLAHWLAFIFNGAALFVFLMIAADAVAVYLAIRVAIEKEQIRKGIKEIASGNVNYQIPLEKMYGESREMAELVNTIGDGLNNAVAAAMKSERLKTDLITNVSHDIKTPLTSIINYVDLLKRENLEDPKIQGYLEILEAKAQRLKTLTEDVVEASKVSSGNITLEMMDVNLVEMVNQTIGEFSEKMEVKNLTVVASLPEEPAIVHVDGRRMWRVLENIFNNAAKYAMPGTRVYTDLRVREGQVVFSLKNVSENPLNISAEELTERFIRGDVSRSTEGSGLGLSIARDLTEMQGGKFSLYVDGDLFKVVIKFGS